MNSSSEKLIKTLKNNKKMDDKRSIRVGIVGAGLMGHWHARASKKSGGEIISIIDVDKKRANILAQKYPSAKIFDNLTQMLNHLSIDVLHICTPTPTHFKIAEIALKSGINIFVEKPLAKSADETIFLFDLANKNNVQICPTHQFIFQQCVKKAKKCFRSLIRSCT